ncbi:acyltransferase [Simiduia curdlanivorans]|uniref:Acyltransferase family protein n=1 Tax=Simiduia curdlanivorans TaxID=1492769 RepID=A0ABV8VAD1_9GAMM|nr:acyltransferase [Simiduia curdlanivorans]MDN3638507.1 acyltransferase [Simiduia curdlanivorans]
MNNNTFYKNNFNLIRIFAALQVVHYHLVSIYGVDASYFHVVVLKILGFFPGVPVFFFISGLLISRSWESSRSWKDYALKRAARIEPALFVSVIFAIALIYTTNYFELAGSPPDIFQLILLTLSKVTIVQFYNPDYLRAYGDGVLNGSLWTITVELQFYILIPLLYLIAGKRIPKIAFFSMFFIFIFANILYDYLSSNISNNIPLKLFRVSFAPWIFMFIAGVIFQQNFERAHRYLNGKFTPLLIGYLAFSYGALQLGADFGNSLNPLMFIFLSAVIFSAAYTNESLADNTLSNIDISYGTYLYHMPIINWFLYSKITPTYLTGTLIFVITLIVSLASWLFIEKPALDLAKRHIKRNESKNKAAAS